MRLNRRALMAWAGLLLLTPAARDLLAQSPAPVTIFVVRHAERENTEADSPLSAIGKARAERLAAMLADAGITRAFSTEFIRTKDTVAPLATKLGITAVAVPGRDMNALIGALQALEPGTRALVAGHSNTVNVIVGRLTGQQIPALADTDYDRLYVVTVAGGASSWVMLRF